MSALNNILGVLHGEFTTMELTFTRFLIEKGTYRNMLLFLNSLLYYAAHALSVIVTLQCTVILLYPKLMLFIPNTAASLKLLTVYIHICNKKYFGILIELAVWASFYFTFLNRSFVKSYCIWYIVALHITCMAHTALLRIILTIQQ